MHGQVCQNRGGNILRTIAWLYLKVPMPHFIAYPLGTLLDIIPGFNETLEDVYNWDVDREYARLWGCTPEEVRETIESLFTVVCTLEEDKDE